MSTHNDIDERGAEPSSGRLIRRVAVRTTRVAPLWCVGRAEGGPWAPGNISGYSAIENPHPCAVVGGCDGEAQCNIYDTQSCISWWHWNTIRTPGDPNPCSREG